MVSMKSSCGLFGVSGHHVTALAAMFLCHLLLTSVQAAANADALDLLAENEPHIIHRQPPSFLHHSPSHPSSPSDDEEDASASAGSDVMNDEPETEIEADTGKRFWKRVLGEEESSAWAKRFIQGFHGSRGKRGPTELSALEDIYGDGTLSKRFLQGFVGSRGKRGMEGEETVAERFLSEGARGKRFHPFRFAASRGKRYMPGLEALLLSQMYKKLDAEKWKRQSMIGFHAARG